MAATSSTSSSNDASSSSSSSSPPPTEAMMVLMSPDGYYTYLNIPKPSSTVAAATTSPPSDNTAGDCEVDIDLVKKNYRRLSIRHHPDKPSGDVETFRLLTRAKVVLSNPKLRKQYDLLGVDLHDEHENDHDVGSGDPNNATGGSDTDGTTNNQNSSSGGGESGIIQEIASMALTTVLSVTFRTFILAITSLLVVHFRILLFPALAFMAYIVYKIHSTPGASTSQIIPPLSIAVGLIIMYQALNGNVAAESMLDGGTAATTTTTTNWVLYWLGESMVVCVFIYNTVPMDQFSQTLHRPIVGVIVVVGVLASLWFRGKFWNYVLVICLEGLLALFIAVAFPIFEMLLEAVVNEKLKKVGEKVRQHHYHMESYYKSKSK